MKNWLPVSRARYEQLEKDMVRLIRVLAEVTEMNDPRNRPPGTPPPVLEFRPVLVPDPPA